MLCPLSLFRTPYDPMVSLSCFSVKAIRFETTNRGNNGFQHTSNILHFFLTLIGYIGKKHLNRAIEEVLNNPLPNAPRPLSFSVIRVPFFLEPHYDENKEYEMTNRERLINKWGGPQGWEEQKLRHDLKGRGLEAGIPHFNLDRKAANSMASHRLIQYIGKNYGLDISEAIYDKLNV